jgi:hypothetical protein
MTQTVTGSKVADKSAEAMLANMSAATQRANELFTNTSSKIFVAAQGYNTKVVEFARQNADAAFEYFEELAGAKSPSEFIAVTTKHAHHQLEVLTQQTKELTALAQKLTQETAESVR